jgi:hypothetical protein
MGSLFGEGLREVEYTVTLHNAGGLGETGERCEPLAGVT